MFLRRRFKGIAPFLAGTMVIAPILALSAQNPTDKPSVEKYRAVAEYVRSSKGSGPAVTEARTLGIAASRAGLYDAVEWLFGAILEFYPDDPEALYYRSLALFNLRRVAESEPVARAAVKAASAALNSALPPEKAAKQTSDALVLLGVILAVQGKNNEAATAVTQAVTLSPGSFDAQFALGRALYGAGDMVGAVEAFRRAADL
jgi:tetratricopeptide (TPR) repeat protein